MFKRFFPLLLLIFLICEPVYAGTYENNNYLRYTLTNSNNTTLWSGGVPFYHEFQANQYSKFRLYLHYTNYTTYNTYYYDVTLKINFDSQGFPRVTLNNLVDSCNAYVEGSYTWSNDGCRIVSNSFDNTLTVAVNNLHSNDSGLITFVLYTKDMSSAPNLYNDFVQVSSYTLTINAKEDNSVSSQTIDNAANSIIDNANDHQRETNERLEGIDDSINDVNDSINNSDTSQANSTGSNWFSGFRVDSSRGFSSIITAPIRLIQGILNGSSSCSPLSFDVSLKHNSTTQSNEVSLPCGSILWNNVPNTAVLLYHSTIFGLFAWFVLSDMYKFIDSIRDPDDKTEFVMKL